MPKKVCELKSDAEATKPKAKRSTPYQEFSKRNWDSKLSLPENSKHISAMWKVQTKPKPKPISKEIVSSSPVLNPVPVIVP